MKVVHITPAVFGPGKRGGGERYVSELVRAQKELGLDVTLVELPTPWSANNVEVTQETSTRIGLPSVISVLRAADVVHVHQLNTSAFDVAAVIGRFSSYKLVLTDHGGGNLTPGRVFGSRRLHAVDGAAYVSHWSRGDVDPHGRVRNFSVVYGGGDHIPSEGQRRTREYDFGFVGRLLPHKGAHIAIQALPHNATLVVAGEARDIGYLAYLQRLAIGKKVTFRHDLPDTSMADLYESIGYLVVPSVTEFGEKTYARPELLGLVALESLCLGTPVIGSAVGGLGEFLHDAGQRVVPPGDVEAWRESMTSAFAQEPSAVRHDPFTWRAVAVKCGDLYSSLLGSS
jgi:glycosyltransferase involved in cell wall biosynthesis